MIIGYEPRKSYIPLCKLQLNVNRTCILLLFYVRIICKGQFYYKYDLFWVHYISPWCVPDEETWFNDSHIGLSPFIRGSRPWSNVYLPMTFIFNPSIHLDFSSKEQSPSLLRLFSIFEKVLEGFWLMSMLYDCQIKWWILNSGILNMSIDTWQTCARLNASNNWLVGRKKGVGYEIEYPWNQDYELLDKFH